MLRQTKRLLILIAALALLTVGLLALVLPVLPGIVFIVLGLLLISILSPSFRAWLDKHTVHYPKLHSAILKIDGWLRKTVGEV